MARDAASLFSKGFRSRDGRDSACAQLRAFSQSLNDTAPSLQRGALHCPVALVLGSADPLMSQGGAACLQQALREASDDRLACDRLAGVAHMAPEEAPDRLGTIVGQMITTPM